MLGAMKWFCLVLLSCAAGAEAPHGWQLSATPSGAYAANRTLEVVHQGVGSASLRSLTPGEFGVLLQRVDASPFRGRRVRLRSVVRSRGVDGSSWAGLLLRIDPRRGPSLGFDNMQERPLRGTFDWRVVWSELDVPAEAAAVTFGVLLCGSGQVWLDDVELTAVGPSRPGGRLRQRLRGDEKKPTNLDFETP